MAKEQNACPVKKTSIGGQALIEGVMMRGPQKTAMAVRHTVTKEITLEEWDNPVNNRAAWTKWPVIRGVFNFIDSMVAGYKSLMRSAELSGMEDEIKEEEAKEKAAKEAKKAAKAAKKAGADTPPVTETPAEEVPAEEPAQPTEPAEPAEPTEPAPAEEKKESGLMGGIMVVSAVLGVVLALFLFKFVPEWLYQWIFGNAPVTGYGASLLRAVFTGVLKILILVAYMAAVSLMKDIRRTFEYHGAEHKTIFCYEAGLELTVDNVRKQRRFHPRCGTSFLILMVLVSIFINMFIPAKLVAGGLVNTLLRTAVGIALLPLIMGLGYELIRLAGRKDNLFTRIVSAPGVWLQHITTREPDDSMIECAIASLKAVIPDDPEADNW